MCADRPSTLAGPIGTSKKKYIQTKLCVSQKTGRGRGRLSLVERSTNKKQVQTRDKDSGGRSLEHFMKLKVSPK